MLDFYTLTTDIDLTDKANCATVVQAIGCVTQPLIMGEPVEQDGSFMYRFAVRNGTMQGREADVMSALTLNDPQFTTDNTQLVQASRI